MYVVGFNNLPTIDAADIRAAYAVAQNTSKDQNGYDYWVADVIVIETDDTVDSFDSIALMYYNPNEFSGEVRNVNSLSNSWRVLQPNYAELAKMTIVPDSTNRTGASAIWGNNSWSDYGFYAQYNENLTEEGRMEVSDSIKIINNFNDHGIYAGTVDRIESLVGSNYIDIKDSDGNHHYVNVRSSDYNTPVYRITTSRTITSANTINLTGSLTTSDVQVGDEVIYVYRHNDTTADAYKQAAYIIDVATRDDDGNGVNDWTVPGWLYTLWSSIMADQIASGLTDAATLIQKAQALDNQVNPALADLQTMIKALNAALTNGNVTMSNTQRTTILGLIASLTAKAAAPAREAAKAEALAEANKVLKNDEATSAQKLAVTTALNAVNTAIDVATIDENGEINVNTDALTDAVALALAQIDALKVLASAVDGLDVTTAGALKTAYDNAVNAVNTASDVDDVEAVVKDGKVVDTTLNTAIANAKGSAAVDAAKDAVDELVDAKFDDVQAVQDAKDALDALIDALDPTDETDTKVLAAISAGDWDTVLMLDSTVYAAYAALLAAIDANSADADSKAEEDAAIDAAVTAGNGITTGAAAVPAGGMGYSEAYATMGVSVVGNTSPMTITVNKADFLAKIADPTEAEKQAIITMDQGGGHEALAAGISLLAPDGTESVTFTRTIFYEDGTEATADLEWSVTGNPQTMVSANGHVYMNLWFTLVTGTVNSSTQVVTGAEFAPGKTAVFELQFKDSEGDNIGGVIERTIVVTFE